jgi:transposase, IS605 OrfB family, central region
MQYHYGLKMRCYPSDQQKQLIKINSDASRFIYNEMVAIGKELMQLRRVKLSIDTVQERIKQLTMRQNAKQMSNHYQFLEDKRIDSLAKANAIQNYRKAWNAFRKIHTAGVPKFHRKSYRWRYQTNCQYPGQKTALLTNGTVCFLDKHHVKVPKIGRLRIAGSQARLLKRACETRIGTVTLTKDPADRFFISMQLASDQPFVKAVRANQGHVGIDLNTDNFLTDSQGHFVPNPRYYRTIKGKLAKEQRILSRRQRRAKKEHRSLQNSKNYQKQRLLVAKLHAKVMNQRHNFLQQISTALIKNHDLVVAEELRSKNMLKNHALALSISDVGWRTFLGMLAYKADLYGRQFITISPKILHKHVTIVAL